jgi:hypothetical protein
MLAHNVYRMVNGLVRLDGSKLLVRGKQIFECKRHSYASSTLLDSFSPRNVASTVIYWAMLIFVSSDVSPSHREPS